MKKRILSLALALLMLAALVAGCADNTPPNQQRSDEISPSPVNTPDEPSTDTATDMVVEEALFPGEVLLNGVPLLWVMSFSVEDDSSCDILEGLGEYLDFEDTRNGPIVSYDGYVINYNWNMTKIELIEIIDLRVLTINGVALDKTQTELILALGDPTWEWTDDAGLYMMDYLKWDDSISVLVSFALSDPNAKAHSASVSLYHDGFDDDEWEFVFDGTEHYTGITREQLLSSPDDYWWAKVYFTPCEIIFIYEPKKYLVRLGDSGNDYLVLDGRTSLEPEYDVGDIISIYGRFEKNGELTVNDYTEEAPLISINRIEYIGKAATNQSGSILTGDGFPLSSGDTVYIRAGGFALTTVYEGRVTSIDSAGSVNVRWERALLMGLFGIISSTHSITYNAFGQGSYILNGTTMPIGSRTNYRANQLFRNANNVFGD
jgi:hypothetical protein